MPDAKRPDPKRRAPASRPGKGGEAKGRPRGAAPIRREPRVAEPRPTPEVEPEGNGEPEDNPDPDPGVIGSIKTAIAEAADHQSEQRFGSAARRAAILAAVVCVLTLTIAGPVRTYFAQRTEMNQLATAEAQLRSQIADLEQQKVKLADPVYIAAAGAGTAGFRDAGRDSLPGAVAGAGGFAGPSRHGRRRAAQRSAVVHVAVAHHRRCAARGFVRTDAGSRAAAGAATGSRCPTSCSARWLIRRIWTPWPASWVVSRAVSSRSRTDVRTASPVW